MNKNKHFLKPLLVFAFWLTLSVPVSAQPLPEDDDVEDVPIDGGISLLVAAGVAYGAKISYERQKKQEKFLK